MSIIPESSRDVIFDHCSIPLLSKFADHAFCKIVIQAIGLCGRMIKAIFADVFHELSVLPALLTRSVSRQVFGSPKVMNELS